jgi:hypothetical protein
METSVVQLVINVEESDNKNSNLGSKMSQTLNNSVNISV